MEYNTKTASCHAIQYYNQPIIYQQSKSSSVRRSSSSMSSRQKMIHKSIADNDKRCHSYYQYDDDSEDNDYDDGDPDEEEEAAIAAAAEPEDENEPELPPILYQKQRCHHYHGRPYKYNAIEECCRPIFQDQHFDTIAEML
ncbi:uncharacterized protein LOC6648748 [Drosophila willistoni]|uniref:uncharacterized protein LOC6648748 n=1 Tax=Drosophila willistoni TaxID=7260 RepID=UPI000C26C794|nr:uncharacterized protein LOC6648748 [Drosophila willistoni]